MERDIRSPHFKLVFQISKMRKKAWDSLDRPDVLGHEIVKHRAGQNVCDLVDTFWSYFDVDKNETTYCFGKRRNPWSEPTVANLVRFQLNTDQLKKIFLAPDNYVETDSEVLEAEEGDPWFLAWKGRKISHYYVRDRSKSKLWKQHANEVSYTIGFEAGRTPRNPGELCKPFEVRKNIAPKKRKPDKTKPTVAALNKGFIYFL